MYFESMEKPALHLLPEGEGEKTRRRNRYKRIRSRAREHYVQSCGCSYGKPPLPQGIYSELIFLSCDTRKSVILVPTMSDTNWPIQSQVQARSFKFGFKKKRNST